MTEPCEDCGVSVEWDHESEEHICSRCRELREAKDKIKVLEFKLNDIIDNFRIANNYVEEWFTDAVATKNADWVVNNDNNIGPKYRTCLIPVCRKLPTRRGYCNEHFEEALKKGTLNETP